MNIPLLENLEENEKQKFLAIAEKCEFQSEELIVRSHESGSTLYILIKGSASTMIYGEREIHYKSGDFFGEVGFLNNQFRIGSVVASSNVELLAIDSKDFFDNEKLSAAIALKIVRKLAQKVTTYLHTNETLPTANVIEYGENEIVEFKSTLRWNIYTKKVDRNIEHASLKTIAAFLNSDGGTLLIGVEDDKNVKGIALDNFPNDDKALLHFTNLIKTRISMQQLCNIKMAIEKLNDVDVIRVDVRPSKIPVYMNNASNNDEIFYVRTGPSTSQLKVSEIFDYIRKRF